jgi:hypothetical protein
MVNKNMKKIGTNLLIILSVLLITGKSGTVIAQSFSFEPSLTWERIDTTKMPAPRAGFSLTVNETNQVALFFGGYGYDAGVLNDLWLTDGSQWLELFTPHRPPERSNSSLVYDKDRQEAVLFGGASSVSGVTAYLDDTWVFNGKDWIKQLAQVSPSPRADASIVYDPDHQRIYLFGGSYSLEKDTWKYNDTWAWDGSSWQQIQLNNQPSIRDNAAMAYDPVHHNILLYGGASIAAPLNDTWIWNGEVWTEQQPVHQPGKDRILEYPQMVFDTNRQQVLMVGSARDFPNPVSYTKTWAWDGQDWVELPVAHPLPAELMLNGKLVYLPGMRTVAIVNTFTQKVVNPDGTTLLVDRSEVWALVNRNYMYIPIVSR